MICGISYTRKNCTAHCDGYHCADAAGCNGSIDYEAGCSSSRSSYGSPLPEVFSIDRRVDPANQSSNQEACDRVDKAAITIHVYRRITDPVHIQVSALHDSSDLRRVGIRFQAQPILALVDLLGIIAVDAVGRRPVGILLGEAANARIVMSRAEIIGLRLAVKILAAVAERVLILRVRILLYAERIVIVGPCACSGAVRQSGVFRAGGQDLPFLLSRQLLRRHRDVQSLDFQAPFFCVTVLTRQGNLGPEGGDTL